MASDAKPQPPPAELAGVALDEARRAGAQSAAATATLSRDVTAEWRDGRIERISEASERSLSLDLFVDGRYFSVTTSDLRPEAIGEFVKTAVALARALVADKDRALPDDPYLTSSLRTPTLVLEGVHFAGV